jgi:prepilin-type N-terminal cleavage/methylation domain-containing protein
MKKSGFTLIELLAVIVILALVALISVPLVLGIIGKVQKSSYEASMRSVFAAADLYIASNEFIIFPDEGINVMDDKIQIKNKNFTSGKIIKNEDGILELDKVSNGKYCAGGTMEDIIVIEGSCDLLDTTPPTISITSNLVTSSSITIVANAEDLESGINGYQFSKDNGSTWTVKQISNVYNFTGLTNDTSYTFKVRVYNNNELSTISEELVVTTNDIPIPTYSINPSTPTLSAVVTINYPERQTGYVYEYSLDNALTWEEVEQPLTSKDLLFEENGNVIARIKDGTNIVSGATYSVMNVDTTAPVITITLDNNNYNTSHTMTINIVEPNFSQAKKYYVFNTSNETPSSGWTAYTGNTITQSGVTGEYYLHIKAIDDIGNESVKTSDVIKMNNLNLATSSAYYKFDDFQEPTENLLSNVIDTTFESFSLSGWSPYSTVTYEITDEIKFNNKPVIKLMANPDGTGGIAATTSIRVPANTVATMSMWIYIPNDVTLTSNWEIHRHALPDGACLGGSCHHYSEVNYTNKDWNNTTPKGTWVKREVVLKTHNDDNVTSGYNLRIFCYANGANPAGSYIYMTQPQIELKPYDTPFTANTRTGTVQDYSNNNYIASLSLSNTPRWITDSKVGAGAYSFDGVNDYILSNNNITLNGSQTFAAWIKPTTLSGLKGIISVHNHSINSNLGLNLTGNKLSLSIGYTDETREYSTKISNQSIPLNVWSHVAMVYDSANNKIKIYINGALDSEHLVTKPIKFTNNKILVGQWSTSYLNNYVYDGIIDEALVFNRNLSDGEIKAIYETQK